MCRFPYRYLVTTQPSLLNLGSSAARTAPSPRLNSGGLTGGVCKEQGHIHRVMLTRDYYGIHLREGGLQPSVRTTNGFRDCLHLSVADPIVPSFVARGLPGGFGASGPTVDLCFLSSSTSAPPTARPPARTTY